MGLCPIVPGESVTRTALLNFDSHKGEVEWAAMCVVAHKVYAAACERGLHPMPFRSSGGNGIHLLFAWQNPQDCYTVRQTLTRILADCRLTSGTKGVAHKTVEVLPKQDAVAADGFGNMWVLPFAKESVALDEDMEIKPNTPPLRFSGPLERIEKPVIERTSSAPDAPELSRVVDAVKALKPGSFDYEEWRSIVFGIHDATEGSEEGERLAQWFNDNVMEHERGRDWLSEQVWPYIRLPQPSKPMITVGSLFHKAAEAGWIDPKRAPTTDGFEDFGEQREQQSQAPDAPEGKAFTFLPEHQWSAAQPPLKWFVKGLLPRGELCIIYGEPGHGKTLIAMSLAPHIALGLEWCGHKVKEACVAYVVAEGAPGFANRLRALRRQMGRESLGFQVVSSALNLRSPKEMKALAESLIGKFDVVFIDTWSRVLPGANENSAEDVSPAIDACARITRAGGPMFIFVAHRSKDTSRGVRGWSGIKAALDFEMEVQEDSKEPQRHIATPTKLKDAEKRSVYAFRRESYTLEQDEDGDIISAPVAVFDRGMAAPVKVSGWRPTGKWQAGAMDVLNDGALIGYPEAELIEAVLRRYNVHERDDAEDEKEHKEKLRQARRSVKGVIQELIDRGALALYDNRVLLMSVFNSGEHLL